MTCRHSSGFHLLGGSRPAVAGGERSQELDRAERLSDDTALSIAA
jgi:hypothetical protein